MAYDCFGAGQAVTQELYPTTDWRTSPEQANQIYKVFLSVRQLHQMLWYLIEASTIIPAEKLKTDIDLRTAELEQMARRSPEEILLLDLESCRARVNPLLQQTGALVHAASGGAGSNAATADLIGKNFKGARLDRRDFSMSLLIAANLRGCSLYGANLLGADMRDANIADADLSESIFLTQGQINAARGNHNTKLPPALAHPTAWQNL